MEAALCNTEEEAPDYGPNNFNGKNNQYPVYYFPSDTSGEKMYEEFYTKEEEIDWDTFHALGVIQGSGAKSIDEIKDMTAALERLFSSKNLEKSAIIEQLSKFLPTFRHIEKGKNLDQRM